MEKNNSKKPDAGCDKYGKQRLELSLFVKNNVLKFIPNTWFIENGTLLGAWRDQKFIPHDDDFDIAILLNSIEEISKIYNLITDFLSNSKYKARLIDTYSLKIEIYDDSFGKYVLPAIKYNNADFHYVTLDLQFYLNNSNNVYEKLYFINPIKNFYEKDLLIPTQEILLEGEIFNAPCKIEQFLEKTYGSLDKNAVYNSKTGLYEL